MDRKYTLPKAAVLIVFLSCTFSFTLRKKSSQNPSDLARALNVLQRQRRRVDMDEYLRNNLDALQQQPYDPYEEYGALDGRYTLEDLLAAYPQYMEELEQDREDPEIPQGVPSLAELKNLFDSDGQEQQGQGSIIDEATKVKDNSNIHKNKITKLQMQNLLNQVKDEETKEIEETANADTDSLSTETEDGSTSEGTPKPEMVTQEELQDIFGGQDADRIEESDSEENINEETIPRAGLFPAGKEKRVAKRDNGESLQSDRDEEIADLHNEIARLRLIESLEDSENDFLASALKEATLSQMDAGQDTYLKPEYRDIENAIRNEEILQDLKSNPSVTMDIKSLQQLAHDRVLDVLPETEIDDENEVIPDAQFDDEAGEDDELEEEPTLEDNTGTWYDNPIPDEESTEDKENAEAVLEQFVKQYLQQNEPEENDLESCPTVDVINTNCAIADRMGLPIDDEARDLCNRHELCYVCGHSLGMSEGQCDQGFESEVIEICGRNTNCIRDGAQFLWLIKSGQHYSWQPADECADPCVRDFILGL